MFNFEFLAYNKFLQQTILNVHILYIDDDKDLCIYFLETACSERDIVITTLVR